MKIKRTLKNNFGFTLIELLVTVAILAVLIILALIAWQNHLNQARDAQRKSDLERISIAFENYYNDKECFPAEDILQICGGDSLNPYLNIIPCDPVYILPYCYIHDPNDTCGQSYKILAPLKAASDSIIEKLLCNGGLYCGYEPNCAASISPPAGSDYGGFNYGVTSGNVQLYNPDAGSSPSPSSSPLPSPTSQTWACTKGDVGAGSPGECNSYSDPIESGCNVWYYTDDCDSECTLDPTNWCLE